MSELPPPPPPNYSYSLPGYAPVRGLRAIGKVARALLILQVILAAANVASILALLGVNRWGQRYLDDELTSDEFTRKVAPYLFAGIVLAAVSVAALVLLCIWSFRMAKNLPLLGRQNQTWAAAWGIAGWLLSGCTLGILPYLMHAELWKGSDPERAPGDPGWKSEPVDPLWSVWLALTIGGTLLGLAGGLGRSTYGLGRRTSDLAKGLRDGLAVNVIAALVSAAASIALAVFVQRLSRRHMAATGEQ